ncbi:MAG: hypothetical protein U1D30_18285 [Planctomycetota bacterium]
MGFTARELAKSGTPVNLDGRESKSLVRYLSSRTMVKEHDASEGKRMQRRKFLASAGALGMWAGCDANGGETKTPEESDRRAEFDALAHRDMLLQLLRTHWGKQLSDSQLEELERQLAGNEQSIQEMRSYPLAVDDAPVFAPSSLFRSEPSS